jgi:hypothetical protein
MPNYKTGDKRDTRDVAEVKAQMVASLAQGLTVKESLARIRRSQSWYEMWRRKDAEFASACDTARQVRAARVDAAPEAEVAGFGDAQALPPFPAWSARYLHNRVFPHQQNMIDVVEGREPSSLHPSMRYEPGTMGNRRVLINIPPNNAKTMTLSINYVTYRVIANPNINVLIVSKTQDMAKKILYAIKQRLTHPRYAELQRTYGPPDGFKATADQWSATRIYLGSEARDSGEKDPTVEAIGIGSQIYGSRASLILLDDTVTLSNSGEYEKQDDWLRQEVASRLGPGGQIVIVGTRVAPLDLYRHLRDPEGYTDGSVPWTYLSMPAVLEYGDTPADWETLWPVSDEPFVENDACVGSSEDGVPLYPRWTGPRLSAVRNEVGPKRWSMVYQQADVADDATFDAICVRACVEGTRRPGPLTDRDGWHVLIGVDPAIAGTAAVVAYAVNRGTGERKVLDVKTITSPTPLQLRTLITDQVDVHSPHEVIIETNAFQGFLSKDEMLGQYLANRGIVLRPHHTNTNKTDPDFGVAAMSSLFGTRTTAQVGQPSKHNGDNLLSLPRVDQTAGLKVLVEELVSWNPELPVKRRKQDTVMAMWFCELRARELVVRPGQSTTYHVRNNKYLTPAARARQVVVNLNELAAEQANQSVWL